MGPWWLANPAGERLGPVRSRWATYNSDQVPASMMNINFRDPSIELRTILEILYESGQLAQRRWPKFGCGLSPKGKRSLFFRGNVFHLHRVFDFRFRSKQFVYTTCLYIHMFYFRYIIVIFFLLNVMTSWNKFCSQTSKIHEKVDKTSKFCPNCEKSNSQFVRVVYPIIIVNSPIVLSHTFDDVKTVWYENSTSISDFLIAVFVSIASDSDSSTFLVDHALFLTFGFWLWSRW